MRHSVAWLGAGLVGAAASLIVCFSGRAWMAGREGSGTKAEPDVLDERERRRGERLNAQLAEIYRRSRAANQVFAELRRGRLSLWEAAARYRVIDCRSADPARHVRLLRLLFPGASDAERYCRLIIASVRNDEGDPAANARAARRLEGKLEDRLRRPGGVRLPEVPAKD
jgi:hypothetical protein